MVVWFLLALVLTAAYTYRRGLQPTQVEPGGAWRLVDHRDGPWRLFIAFLAVLIGSHMAVNMAAGVLLSAPSHPVDALVFLAIGGGLYALLLGTEGRRLLEAVYASPGELYVSQWPLQAGEQVEVTYRRRLHRGRPAGEVNARLMLWSKHRRKHLNHTHQLWRHVLRHEAVLEDGEASFQDGTLVATWRFQVPTWGRDEAPTFGRRGVIAEMLGFYKDMDYWELHIDMPLSRHLRLDSRMRLDIDFVSPHLPQKRGA